MDKPAYLDIFRMILFGNQSSISSYAKNSRFESTKTGSSSSSWNTKKIGSAGSQMNRVSAKRPYLLKNLARVWYDTIPLYKNSDPSRLSSS